MNNILVLVDFTSTSEIALAQAIESAKLNNAAIELLHVTNSDGDSETDEFKSLLAPYTNTLDESGVDYSLNFKSGKFQSVIADHIQNIRPDLVVVGTHGKQGIRQNLFGSNIYKLIKAAKASTLVVNDQFKPAVGGLKKVLVPVSAHQDYLYMLKRTCELIDKQGEVVLLNIDKEGIDLNDAIKKNINDAKDYLDHNQISYRYVELESMDFSVGYSKETIRYAAVNGYDMISILTEVASIQETSAHLDKENVLLNKDGIAVLSVGQ